MIRRWLPALGTSFFLLTTAVHAGDFIRVQEDASHARLQTAITRYERNGTIVDLIGAIHIADKDYYDALNLRFTGYNVLLYEMIGGENIAARLTTPAKAAPPANEKARKLDGLKQLYDGACEMLQLSSQSAVIDYTAKNFLHADLTLEEFEALQAQRKESILSFFLLASLKHQETRQPNSLRLLRAMLTKNPELMKQELLITMDSSEDQIAAFAGENVIIGDRNARCMEVLAGQIAANQRKIGIFYGAAHFPDMEKRLLALGFHRVAQEWLTAWDVRKEVRRPALKGPVIPAS